MTGDQQGAEPVARPVDDEGKIRYTLRVNGHEHRVRAGAHHTLLEVLRGQLKLFSVREGCGIGMCGSCAVLLNGRVVSSCLMLAVLAEGNDILTVEGLADAAGNLDPVQQCYVDHNSFQCSYCTPGFLLTTKALLEENHEPSEEEVRRYLSGNLCRCGSYVEILRAVMAAKKKLHGPEEDAHVNT